MGEVRSHLDLEVWKVSMDFVVEIYKLTAAFPDHEKYGLTSQIRRAAVSIPSNIAEGSARRNSKELIQFLYISLGSVAEIETQLILSKRLSYIKEYQELSEKIHYIRVLITRLIKSIKNKLNE
jgi:four helix bundle protein